MNRPRRSPEGEIAPAAPRAGLVRRHRVVAVLAAATLLFLAAVGGWLIVLDRRIADIPRFDAGLDRSGRPTRVHGEATNILLAGVDDGQGAELRDALQADRWPPGVFRSDSIMIVHLSADRRRAQVVGIPRDSWVPIPGHGRAKVNAAFSYGGPPLFVHTIEDLTGLFIDHVAVVDMAGFSAITEAVGGVDLRVPGAGVAHLEGDEALAYVRERKSLPQGDFDRIRRQQNLLRAMLQKGLSRGVLANPARLTGLVGSVSTHLAVDRRLDAGKLRSLALETRALRLDDVAFATIPHDGTDTVDGASVVRLDGQATRSMFAAIATDRFDAWRRRHQVDGLPSPSHVQ